MADRKKEGISKLAKTLDIRIKEHSESGLEFDFGVIKKGMYLQPNTMNVKISKRDYSALSNLKGNLSSGDHVVFIWVQDEPVILGKVVKGSAI